MDMLTSRELGSGLGAPTFSVKVRGTTYLWGSAGISKNLKFEKALVLYIANDPAGEAVKVGTQVASGAKTELGILQPGERMSAPVNDISGVYADCTSESLVHCMIY